VDGGPGLGAGESSGASQCPWCLQPGIRYARKGLVCVCVMVTGASFGVFRHIGRKGQRGPSGVVSERILRSLDIIGASMTGDKWHPVS